MSSRESTGQGESGKQGARASQTPGTGDQPRQGSNRTELYGTGSQETKHHFAPGQAPSEQGSQENPGPERIREHQQGFSGSGTGQSGSTSATGVQADRSEEMASEGEPRGQEARHGRHDTQDPRH